MKVDAKHFCIKAPLRPCPFVWRATLLTIFRPLSKLPTRYKIANKGFLYKFAVDLEQ